MPAVITRNGSRVLLGAALVLTLLVLLGTALIAVLVQARGRARAAPAAWSAAGRDPAPRRSRPD